MDADLAAKLANMSEDITEFEGDVKADTDEIDETLEDLQQLETIISDVDDLDQSLTDAQGEIQADVLDTKDDQAGRNTANLALIAVVLVLTILVLFLVFRTQKLVQEVRDAGTPPEQVDDFENVDMTEVLLEGEGG